MLKVLTVAAMALSSLTIVACGNNNNINETSTPTAESQGERTNDSNSDIFQDLSHFYVGMVTDTGGINDQSFNQSAWEGLERLRLNTMANISNIESTTEASIGPNLDIMLDSNNDIIWATGFATSGAVMQAATINPQQLYGIIDYDFGTSAPDNIVSVIFRDHESSFLAGYMAARTSQTGNIGFIGGMEGEVIDRFEYGFRAGAEYAAATHDLDIEVSVQYVGNFSDDAAGRAIATTMYTNGADIIFHAAGGAGQGVIDTAIDMDLLVIGVDRDQSSLAPNNMLTSVMKFVGEVMYDSSLRVANGENLGGQTLDYGLSENGVGLAPYEGSTANLVDREVYDDTVRVQQSIIDGDINVPANEDEFIQFVEAL